MINYYSWMFGCNESIAQDDGNIVYRKHPDGSPCHAKDPEDCPIICKEHKIEEADNLEKGKQQNTKYEKLDAEKDKELISKISPEVQAYKRAWDNYCNAQIAFINNKGNGELKEKLTDARVKFRMSIKPLREVLEANGLVLKNNTRTSKKPNQSPYVIRRKIS